MQSILFVDAIKRGHEKAHWDSNTQLVLGKCLAGLINRMEKPFDGKQSYAPFRDSKLTRVMKPFLCTYERDFRVKLKSRVANFSGS